MKKCVLVLVLLCVSAYCAFAQSVDSNLIDAVTLYSNGQYQKARTILQTLSKAAPDNDAVWYYLAQAEYRCRDQEAAQEAIQKAVQLDSGNYWYRSMLGSMQLMAGKEDEAMREYESLVKDFPDKSGPVYELLNIYMSQKEYEKTLALLDDIERQRGPSEELTRTKYDIYTSMGKQDEGAAVLEKFNQQYSSPSILSMLGDYYLSDFADSLAQARYQEALELDSSYIPALLGMSEVHRHQRRYADYFKTLEPFFASEEIPASSKTLYIKNLTRSIDPKILQLHREGFDHLVLTTTEAHPADSNVLATAGSYFYTTGREEKAGEWFKTLADTFPQSVDQTATYIQYLYLQKQWEQLRERSMEACDRFGMAAFLEYANMASYQLQDYDTIIANCRHILETYPNDRYLCLSSWAFIGDAYHEKGDNKKAYKAYEKALKIDPSYNPVLNNYAYYLSLEGKKLKKAYTMSKKTVEDEPDNATYLDTFAWILHLMGKDLEAKPFFKHAMLYGGKESAVILRHYATVLEALGENDTAKVYRNQAARLDAQEKK